MTWPPHLLFCPAFTASSRRDDNPRLETRDSLLFVVLGDDWMDTCNSIKKKMVLDTRECLMKGRGRREILREQELMTF